MNAINETTLQQTHRVIQQFGLDIPALRDLPATLQGPLTVSQQQALHYLSNMQREVEQMLTAKHPTAFQA